MQEKVAQGDETLQLATVADGQMTKPMLAHHVHASLEFFLRADSQWIRSHYLTDSRFARVASFNHHALHQVALGKDASQHALAQHRHGSNIPRHHSLRNFKTV